MHRKRSIVLAAVPVTLALAVSAALIYHSTNKPTSVLKEYSVVDKQNPSEPVDDLADLEEPTIEGPEPKTTRDFVEDSRPGPETAPETLTPSGPGVTEDSGGWTATGPAN